VRKRRHTAEPSFRPDKNKTVQRRVRKTEEQVTNTEGHK
jgi:hypothetical protein